MKCPTCGHAYNRIAGVEYKCVGKYADIQEIRIDIDGACGHAWSLRIKSTNGILKSLGYRRPK